MRTLPVMNSAFFKTDVSPLYTPCPALLFLTCNMGNNCQLTGDSSKIFPAPSVRHRHKKSFRGWEGNNHSDINSAVSESEVRRIQFKQPPSSTRIICWLIHECSHKGSIHQRWLSLILLTWGSTSCRINVLTLISRKYQLWAWVHPRLCTTKDE